MLRARSHFTGARRHAADERQRGESGHDQSDEKGLHTVVHEIQPFLPGAIRIDALLDRWEGAVYDHRSNWACPRCVALCFGRDPYRHSKWLARNPLCVLFYHSSSIVSSLWSGILVCWPDALIFAETEMQKNRNRWHFFSHLFACVLSSKVVSKRPTPGKNARICAEVQVLTGVFTTQPETECCRVR